jgi:MFS transporter, SP family, arabinose:H+ symporter
MDKRVLAAALIGSTGGLIFGYDLGALSAVSELLRANFHLSPALFGLTISFSLWGTVLGSILAGRIADQVERKKLIAWSALLYALAAIGIIQPVRSEWVLFLIMRFLCGMAIGGLTVGCPLYLAELAPKNLRGRLVSLFQVQVGAGVVIGFSVGLLSARLFATSDVWKWCLGGGVVPSAILFLILLFNPRGANAHLSAGDQNEGRTVKKSPVLAGSSGRERLFRRKYLRPILLATSIAVFNQLSGVNVLLLYMLDILTGAGMSLSLGHTYTVLISCLNLGTTLVGMAFIDKLGRKALLVLGATGMAACFISLGLAIPRHFGPFFYVSILVAYNASFAFSQGTVVWVYLSELFPPEIRGAGQGYGTSVHWIANAILVAIFPIMRRASSIWTFYFFALMMLLQIGIVFAWYPETRGTALDSPL